jgi:hypothetical protein
VLTDCVGVVVDPPDQRKPDFGMPRTRRRAAATYASRPLSRMSRVISTNEIVDGKGGLGEPVQVDPNAVEQNRLLCAADEALRFEEIPVVRVQEEDAAVVGQCKAVHGFDSAPQQNPAPVPLAENIAGPFNHGIDRRHAIGPSGERAIDDRLNHLGKHDIGT